MKFIVNGTILMFGKGFTGHTIRAEPRRKKHLRGSGGKSRPVPFEERRDSEIRHGEA
jgi:hypothetical protein